MSERAQDQPIDGVAIGLEDAFTCGWIRGYGSPESDTLQDMDQQQKHDLGVFTRTYRVADAVDAARAADAAQHATLITERDLLKRGVATVTFGDADAVIAKLVTERDDAQQEAQTLRAERDRQYDQAVEATQRALLAEQALTDTLTDTVTTGHRAALVAYYEGRRASAQQEADEMAVLGSTVRVLSDVAVDDEYQRMIGRR